MWWVRVIKPDAALDTSSWNIVDNEQDRISPPNCTVARLAVYEQLENDAAGAKVEPNRAQIPNPKSTIEK